MTPTPKQVSDFAKSYERLYIANSQLEAAVKVLREENEKLREELKLAYGKPIQSPYELKEPNI